MPILRVFSSETVLAIFIDAGKKGGGQTASFYELKLKVYLPTIVREGPIGLSHAMCVFFFLDRRAAIVGGIDQLRR